LLKLVDERDLDGILEIRLSKLIGLGWCDGAERGGEDICWCSQREDTDWLIARDGCAQVGCCSILHDAMDDSGADSAEEENNDIIGRWLTIGGDELG
jgi:hypothetical protein